MLYIDNFRLEYKSEFPQKPFRQGGNYTLCIKKLVSQGLIGENKYFYPGLGYHDGKIKVVGYFNRMPDNFDGRTYKIYRVLRNGTRSTYLPLPSSLLSVLGISIKHRALVDYSFGFSNDDFIIIIEKHK